MTRTRIAEDEEHCRITDNEEQEQLGRSDSPREKTRASQWLSK